MVVPAADGTAGETADTVDNEAFVFFFDIAADFIELRSHGVQTVTFFEPDPAGMDNAGNAFGTGCQDGQDRNQIRAVFDVNDPSSQFRRAGRQCCLAFDLATHVVDEGDNDFIALRRLRPQARAADGPAQTAGREPESGLRIIAFDDVSPGTIVLIARNPVEAILFFFNDDAVLAQAVEGHVDIAGRFQRCRTAQDRVAIEEGQGHEQARKELGTDVAGQRIRSRL